jgi:hypothetical protein
VSSIAAAAAAMVMLETAAFVAENNLEIGGRYQILLSISETTEDEMR